MGLGVINFSFAGGNVPVSMVHKPFIRLIE